MSTLPGDDAWRDAGLAEVDPDGVVELVSERAIELGTDAREDYP